MSAPRVPTLRLRVECVIDVSPDKVADPADLLRNGMHPGLSRFSDAAWGIGSLISRHVTDDAEWTKGEVAQLHADEARGYRNAVAELSELWKTANGIHTTGHREDCSACRAHRELQERLG